ncbi:PepSY domain-containing protein [Shewanella nanhaiensis]|uniref:PepSY domain-containing protein n=1 Tax=Shewanella nanhaiensis TaxID=2864872 RepID=A0ABS7EA05_9GAMM|nr:PepSY domain-containing protein [Shewanella nanhaiensis]MBW8185971.1 PepSY domain-containing protein [Shewanella nanhaiensis]
MNNSSVFKTAAISTLLGLSAIAAVGSANADDAPILPNQDSVSLLQAVALAETNTGGITIEAEREVKMGQAIYEIELLGKNGEKVYTAINIQTGDVILTDNRRKRDEHDDEDDKLEDALFLSGLNSGQYLSLEEVVKQAETQFSGKAWSVELDDDHGSLAYEIKLMTVNGKQIETEVNALTSSAAK